MATIHTVLILLWANKNEICIKDDSREMFDKCAVLNTNTTTVLLNSVKN